MNNRVEAEGRSDSAQSWKPRTQQQKNSDFFEKLEQLEQKISALEKDRNNPLYSRRSEFRKDYCELEELDLKGTNDRKTEKHKLKQQLGKIRSNVNKFQRDLRDVKPSPEFVEKLKEIMEEVENSMMSFKEQQRKVYDELLHEERAYLQEVSAMEKKFESWSQLPAPATAAADVKKAAGAVTVSLPPAVAAFERFLAQTGGHQGGWDDYDHQLFLKLKSKHKNHSTFMRVAGSGIPGRSVDDVRQHDEWYSEYLILKESKKKAIQEWKQGKEVEKNELLVDDDVDELEEEEERKKRKKEEQIEKEREARLKHLNEWKVQKELDKAKMEEARLRQELNKAKEKEKEEKKRMEIKAQVEEYARQRAEEQAILREARQDRQEHEKAAHKITAEEAAKIQERSKKMLEEKQAKIKMKEVKKMEKEKRLQKLKSQVEVNVSRDPSRLYKLTAGWEQRKKEGPGTSGGRPTLQMPHRAVPSWRQGLS